MEDMGWALYALLGMQVILLFLIWRIGVAVEKEIKNHQRISVSVVDKLREQTGILKVQFRKPPAVSQTHYDHIREQTRALRDIRTLLKGLPGTPTIIDWD